VIVDSSAVVAMLAREPDAAALEAALARADEPVIGAATFVEASTVVAARMHDGARAVRELLESFGVEVVAIDEAGAAAAVDGWRRFGRGNHRARLNFGDCLTYGVAAVRGEPILCIGNDFVQTDATVVPLG